MRDFHLPGRSATYATNGMCATSHPLAAKVAVQILESGGNAVDAAIAAGVLLGICEPQMTGIGGDCFILLSPAGSEEVIALNGSGRSPAGLSAAALREAGHTAVPRKSVEAITVPGAIDAFCRLSKDYGKIGIASCLAPAIYYAKAGVPVTPRTAFDWAIAAGTITGDAQKFYLNNGAAATVGQMFKAPNQAEVLERVALEGRDGFYEGEVAEDMVASLNALGGSHTLEDFYNTACEYTTPISGDYKGTELVEHPPNGQGATAILMNNMLQHFDIASMDALGAQRVHIEAEVAKLAYDTRNRMLADENHMTRLEHMLSPETAAQLAALVDPKRVMADPVKLSETVHKDTVYLTVVDKDLMSVSLIYSIYESFGSGMASSKFGINFQNRGAGFTLEEGHPNEAAGDKRPMHTIIPGMLRKDGKVTMPFGVMGGSYQPAGHARFMSNMIDFGMDSQTAIDAPRSFPDAGQLKVERGYSDAVHAELVEMGHDVIVPEVAIGGAQSILINHETGVLEGASDARKDGCALGY
ncbi:gamma-glutamyltransferase family protein [Amylibacter sp. SFDW26]|uniref:gamma-glutamyltransferase family protein n=1 Tax=Amylibacter sp. SFDW26 TaxID=2652722 RepID=UPI001261720A|nr:gamma-glutamyltransferase family protein [Amylibacter sp. SFDW26]KAB7614496.1 gamma-glutamyltransferase family protein [Amylibacter sp. SFDW26]